jgi:hypothetical protein
MQAAIGRAHRDAYRNPSAEATAQLEELQREYTEFKLAEAIQNAISGQPPLRDEQRLRIAALVLGDPR